MNDRHGWETCPVDVSDNYINACRRFVSDDEAFKTFRQDKDYRLILEGDAYEIGTQCLDLLVKNHSDMLPIKNLEKFKENDIYGSPTTHEYPIVGRINPCTIKYINNVLDIQKLVGGDKLDRIVEVGVGFGAMAKLLSAVYDFKEYNLIDLPDVVALAEKYLSNFPELIGRCKFISCDDLVEIKDVDLFISDSCLAECNLETQTKYTEKILKNSKYAYVVYNTRHLMVGQNNYDIFINEVQKTYMIGYVINMGIVFLYLKRKDLL